jgi:hypothetical protein
VPKNYVAAEPGLCKKTQKLRGAAGPQHARLLAERRKDTEKQESKPLYMEMKVGGNPWSSAKSNAIEDLNHSRRDYAGAVQSPFPLRI